MPQTSWSCVHDRTVETHATAPTTTTRASPTGDTDVAASSPPVPTSKEGTAHGNHAAEEHDHLADQDDPEQRTDRGEVPLADGRHPRERQREPRGRDAGEHTGTQGAEVVGTRGTEARSPSPDQHEDARDDDGHGGPHEDRADLRDRDPPGRGGQGEQLAQGPVGVLASAPDQAATTPVPSNHSTDTTCPKAPVAASQPVPCTIPAILAPAIEPLPAALPAR